MEISQEVLKDTVGMFRSYLRSNRPKRMFWNPSSHAERVLEHFCRDGIQYTSLHYALYALTAKVRGDDFVVKLKKMGMPIPKRYLDVGSGWGGMVVAFAKAGAKNCQGIDIDSKLVDFSRNLADEEGVRKLCKFAVSDLCNLMPKDLGQFDLITCIDVAEHVLNPETAFSNLSQLCADGGTILMEIPNKNCPKQIEADPHHMLFGNILLDRNQAIEFYAEQPGRTAEQYDVGYFYSLDEYRKMFQQYGFSVRQSSTSPLAKKAVFDQALSLRDRMPDTAQWSDARRKTVDSAIASYIEKCNHDYLSRDISNELFLETYGVPVFHFELKKLRHNAAL